MYSSSLQNLIDELGRLPGIGPKSAQRIAFWILKSPAEDAVRLAGAISRAKQQVTWCARCFNVAEADPAGAAPYCEVCRDPRRDPTLVCVVEEPRDVAAFERTGGFPGRYHVLQGSINHLEGVGAEQLRVAELLERIAGEGITEVILSTGPNVEGDATALYLKERLSGLEVTVTRLASGVPVGGDLEYADALTLIRALDGRRPMG